MSYPVLSGFSTGRFGSAFDTTVRIPYIPQKRVSHIILLETENPAPRIPSIAPIFRDTRNWEIRKLGRATSWPFFYWENDDNPLGLGMFGVSCFQTKPLGYPEAGGC